MKPSLPVRGFPGGGLTVLGGAGGALGTIRRLRGGLGRGCGSAGTCGKARVVLTDIERPGTMDGLRFAHYIRDRHPSTLLPVSGQMTVPESDISAHSAYFAKPFDPAAALCKVNEMTR